MVINIPAKGNKKLAELVARVKTDKELQSYWRCSNVIAMDRCHMSDHGETHVAIVANLALKLLRMLVESDILPSCVRDYGLTNDDAEVIVVAAALMHDLGHIVHRDKHVFFSVVLASQVLDRVLQGIYHDTIMPVIKSEILHAIVSHHKEIKPLTIEAGVVRVADALDMEEGRARIPFQAGKIDIHSVSAMAIKDVMIRKGKKKPIMIEISMMNSAGIFQVDELLKKKMRHSGVEQFIEVYARIEGEEKKLVKEIRL
jgi:hypothetical protein